MTDDISQLRDLSVRLAIDQMLVQAGGCNTSVKAQHGLWIKASGARLSDAYHPDTFLLCNWEELAAWRKGSIEELEVVSNGGQRLRASVETAMHLAFPHRFVAHLHSVRAISWLVQVGRHDDIRLRLDGLNWQTLPYIHPGIVLANQIEKAIQGRDVDILLLANHGVVIGAETAESLLHLIDEVETRLESETRWSPQGGLGGNNDLLEGWTRADELSNMIAFDSDAIRIASGGTLYPDHCVYLGPSIARASDRNVVSKALESYRNDHGLDAKALIIEGVGTFLRSNSKPAASELLRCLANVVNRVPKHASIQYLANTSIHALIGWDAEAYRLSVEARSLLQDEKGS